MALIFVLSSIPSIEIPETHFLIPFLVHFAEFFILAVLLLWAANDGFRGGVNPGAVMAAFLISALYAVVDELHQIYVPGRVPDMLDVAVDTFGAAVACIVFSFILVALRNRVPGKENSQE